MFAHPSTTPRDILSPRVSRTLAVVATLLLAGCGTLIEGQAGMGREIIFTSSPPGALISLNGVPKGTTPASITFNAWELARGNILATKVGCHPVTIEPTRGVNPTLAGNAIVGGVGGLLVDGLSGSAIRNARSIHIVFKPVSP